MNEPVNISLDQIFRKDSVKEHDPETAKKIYDQVHERYGSNVEEFDENMEINRRIFAQFVNAHPDVSTEMLQDYGESASALFDTQIMSTQIL